MEDREDYYQMLQDENYKTLLDREIQLNNARERSLRQTNANLAGMGLASAGYGQTAQSGIEGQYLNALNEANDTYQETSIANKEAATAYGNERFNAFLQELGAYDMYDEENRNDKLKIYGLVNDDGTINKEEFIKRYGEENLASFEATYDEWVKGNASAEESSFNDELTEAQEKAVKDEKDFLTSNDGRQFSQNFKKGDCIKLSDNTKGKNNVYYRYDGNNLVQISQEEYEKGKHKYWFRSHENSKDMIVDYDGKTVFDKSTANIQQNNKNSMVAAAVLTALGLAPVGSMVAGGAGIGYAANTSSYKDINDNYNWYLEEMKKG